VQNILQHICGNHSNCDDSWCYDKKAAMLGKTVNPPKEHCFDKQADEKTYLQLKEVFDRYANPTMMAQCNHQFDTQTNEALNNAVANVAPKTVCYSGTSSLSSRISLIIGIHNMGHVPFFTTLFEKIGVTMTPTLHRFLLQKSKRKEYKQKYIRQVNVKVNRSRKQRKTWQEVYQERIDNTYGPGVAIAAIDRDSTVPTKKRRTASSKKASGKPCRCGSVSHERTTHRDCPLRKEKGISAPMTDHNRTPIEHGCRSSAIVLPTSNSGNGYLSETYFEEETQEAERTKFVNSLTSNLCLFTVTTQRDGDSVMSHDEI